MAWNKMTVNESEIDTISNTLRDIGTPFQLKTIGHVSLYGNNDERRTYNIRHMKYHTVNGRECHIVEWIDRNLDDKMDDVICSSSRYTVVKEGRKFFAGYEETPDGGIKHFLESIISWDDRGESETTYTQRVLLDLDNGFEPQNQTIDEGDLEKNK